jgi:hypothetical protein
MVFGWHNCCENFDNIKDYAKMGFYRATFGPL